MSDSEVMPHPTPEHVLDALAYWKTLENYVLQERALRKLFTQTYPSSHDMDDVLIKVCSLNDFYSTNIFSPFSVAKHIVALGIDKRLAAGDLTLVNDLSHVRLPNGATRHFYSFATKYCSHHYPEDFPIYDHFVDIMLVRCRMRDSFASFTRKDLKDYSVFYDALLAFQSFYGLEKFSLKELDQYLWVTGKRYFPKSYRKY